MRRPKGEGSVTKLSTGKYRARIELDPMNGKRKWLSVIRDTAPEARKALRELLRKKEVLEVQQEYNDLFPAVVAEFITICKTKMLKPTTIMRYELALNFWVDTFKYKKVSQITTKEINKGISILNDKGLKTGSIRLSLVILSCLFNYMIKLNYIKVNPVTHCAIPKKVRTKKNMEIVSEDEHRQILDYLKPLYDYFRLTGEKTIKARMYVIYLLAYNTGMREGEIAGLTWDCLNVDKKEISVHQQVIRADGKYQIVSPKTEASYREVTISDKLISLLLELQENYRKLGYSTDFIFGSLFKKDTPTPPANIARVFKQCLKGAGIKRHITFHDLRHTHVTSLLEADISVNTVAERIGHAYASTTFDIYGHVLKRAKERAAEICCDFGS